MIFVSDFYKNKFGKKVYKLPIDLGCTCPNRDGTVGKGGCIFCSQNGSGDFMPSRALSIPEQIEEAKALVQKKAFGRAAKNGRTLPENKTPSYIAYFQNFTNTYGNADELKEKYYAALSCPEIVGLSIATRPDCISEKMLSILKELSEKTFLTIELGLQTIHQKTADYIRRGYDTFVYDKAMTDLKKNCPKAHIVTQLILGLPNESDGQMIESVRHVLDCGTDGIKLSVLYVLRGTDLEADYLQNKFQCLSKEHYFLLLKKIIPLFPKDLVVHRLTGDGPKSLLVAPLWTANKRAVLNEISHLVERNRRKLLLLER